MHSPKQVSERESTTGKKPSGWRGAASSSRNTFCSRTLVNTKLQQLTCSSITRLDRAKRSLLIQAPLSIRSLVMKVLTFSSAFSTITQGRQSKSSLQISLLRNYGHRSLKTSQRMWFFQRKLPTKISRWHTEKSHDRSLRTSPFRCLSGGSGCTRQRLRKSPRNDSSRTSVRTSLMRSSLVY